MLLGFCAYFGRFIWTLPIITNIWIISSLTTTFAISVSYNNTVDDIPNISDTGILLPERAIFSFCIVVSAVLLITNAEIRFLYIKNIFQLLNAPEVWKRANCIGLITGNLSAFGLILVGCFQVDVYRAPHYLGAFLCFVVATVYLWMQTALTGKIRAITVINNNAIIMETVKPSIWVSQVINTVLSTVFLIMFTLSKSVFKIQEILGLGTKFDSLEEVFLVSTASEWLLTFSVMAYLLTFIPAFRRLKHESLEEVFLVSTASEWLLTFSVMAYLLTFIPAFRRLKHVSVKSKFDFGSNIIDNMKV